MTKPLNIGVRDLLQAVEYSHCEYVDVLRESFRGKTWKQRYVIISHGYVYVYKNRNAKKPKQSFSLSLFSSVEECEPKIGEDFCFCLRYKDAQTPILFSCDTKERREKWVDTLYSEITEIQSSSNNLSADSGYGSAGIVPRNKPKLSNDNYDEVDETNSNEAASSSSACDENSEYEIMNPARVPNEVKQHTQKKNKSESMDALTEELKMTFGNMQNAQKKQTTEDSPLPGRAGNQFDKTAAPPISQELMQSLSCTSASYLDVQSGDLSVGIEESQTLTAQKDDEMYENLNDSDGSSDSGNTSPKTIYEKPEELQSAGQHKFEKIEYFYDGKQSRAKRLLKTEKHGTFAVYRGESTQYEICVMTSQGLKYFRLYEQNGRISLFTSHQITFGSLEELLSYYSTTDLPRADYKVKLQRGYNSYQR